MTIDLKTIKHISKLSRISVDDAKANKLAGDLNSIFDFIEKLNELNTDNIEPLTSVAETTLKLRTDEVKSENIRDQILKKLTRGK
jgi:aspartyl-tRNA(Asn)/glutamyl-tRNA(Gln) amidotransferase subunit C